jgi:hypothetical protein
MILGKTIKLLKYIYNYKTSRLLLSMMNKGYLTEIGWIDSWRKAQNTDHNGNPIPWCTYSYIQFIENYLFTSITVFEYGSGFSSLFYAKRTKKVVAIENDKQWYNNLIATKPPNIELVFMDLCDGYDTYILSREELFDLIVVDGRQRVNCIKSAIKKISPSGIIVLDDSERPEYTEGLDFLKLNKFKRIDFWGISPTYFHNKCTSIFSKDFNSFLS